MDVAGKHALISALPGGLLCQECQAREDALRAAEEARDAGAREEAKKKKDEEDRRNELAKAWAWQQQQQRA
jgi:hypothetical protein